VFVVSTKDVAYNKQSKLFVTEASTVDKGLQSFWYEGIALLSHKTGEVAEFSISYPIKRAGETLAWVLLPTEAALRSFPTLQGHEIHVLNT
jgi:hypothetical protein